MPTGGVISQRAMPKRQVLCGVSTWGMLGKEVPGCGVAYSAAARGHWLGVREGRDRRLALAHLAEHCTHTLLGQAGLTLFTAFVPLETLHRCQKPRCFWLAIDHGVLLLSQPFGLGTLRLGATHGATGPNLATRETTRPFSEPYAPGFPPDERPALLSSIPSLGHACNRRGRKLPIFPRVGVSLLNCTRRLRRRC